MSTRGFDRIASPQSFKVHPEHFDSSLENINHAGWNEVRHSAGVQRYPDERGLPVDNAGLGSTRLDRERAQTYAQGEPAAHHGYDGRYHAHQELGNFVQGSAGQYHQAGGYIRNHPSNHGTHFAIPSHAPLPPTHQIDGNAHYYNSEHQQRMQESYYPGPSVSTGNRFIQSTGRAPVSWSQQAMPALQTAIPESSNHQEQHSAPRNLHSALASSKRLIDLTKTSGGSEESEGDVPLIQLAQSSPKNSHRQSPTSLAAPHNSPELTASNDDKTESETPKIDWKLPEYEAMYSVDPNGWPIAKISIPGMVRNEVQLNLESPDLELNMFQSVFFPMHQRTYPSPMKDPDPKYSVLNFHIIANIFIAVFQTFEEESQTSAKDADADEVFFCAIDKWRIGRELGREGYQTIRGIQEFCDVGLDVLFWLKAEGLGPERKRRERSDKGTKRGPRAPKEDSKTGSQVGMAKGAAGTKKVNTLVAKRQPKKAASNKVKDGRVKKK